MFGFLCFSVLEERIIEELLYEFKITKLKLEFPGSNPIIKLFFELHVFFNNNPQYLRSSQLDREPRETSTSIQKFKKKQRENFFLTN